MTLAREAWARRNRLRSCVGRFPSCLHKWSRLRPPLRFVWTELTVDHVALKCPIHHLPRGLHRLTFLGDETIEWLFNTCPEIYCGQAVD